MKFFKNLMSFLKKKSMTTTTYQSQKKKKTRWYNHQKKKKTQPLIPNPILNVKHLETIIATESHKASKQAYKAKRSKASKAFQSKQSILKQAKHYLSILILD